MRRKRTSGPLIEYKLVPAENEGGATVLRYVAQHKVVADRSNGFSSVQPLTVYEWIQYMTGEYSKDLALELTDLINACPFRGLRFETPGVVDLAMAKTSTFEFVLVKDERLYNFAMYADIHTFQEQFQKDANNNPHVCVFANLGGDATLVSPKNQHDHHYHGNDEGDKNRYGHLAVFLKRAPEAQIAEVWKAAAATYEDKLSQGHPVWFSTAGGGVRWLHFRFDKRPKYYCYAPFRTLPTECKQK